MEEDDDDDDDDELQSMAMVILLIADFLFGIVEQTTCLGKCKAYLDLS